MIIPFLFVSCNNKENKYGYKVEQQSIERIDKMPNFPSPYKISDWKQKAKDFDSYAFDFNSKLPAGPIIWLDNNQRNIPQITFGLYTAIHDVRQGKYHNNGEFHESLNSLSAILGGGLIGINKTNQNGYNFVKMIQNYFNSDNGWDIMMNNTNANVANLGGGYGRDWWYDVLPNVLFYNICDIFPKVENAEILQRKIADKFCKADSILNGNYDYSYFDYAKMKGMKNNIPLQQDAAGGHGYVLYAAYNKFKEERFLKHAESAISALNNQNESCFYEILLPAGIYTACRLNAEQGCNFDIQKMLNWVFDGNKKVNGRNGWGVILGRWGKYDVSGLQGSIIDGGGYAFLMNSMKMAMFLVPIVKYEPEYARAIGKWMLNNVNASRLFFPNEIPNENQALPELKNITNSIIAYEGLRYEDCYGKSELKKSHPVALGDGPKWNFQNPPESMFSVYSTSPIGILASIVDTTDVKMILRLNCNSTDFYANKKFPIYLYFNPYYSEKRVTYVTENKHYDLFDIISKKYITRSASNKTIINLPANQSSLIVELPSGSLITKKSNKLFVNEEIISYK